MVTLGGSDAYTAGQFFQGLTTDAWRGPLALPAGRKLTTVVPGQAEGPIVGGNLTVLTSLVGTPYASMGRVVSWSWRILAKMLTALTAC